MGKNVVIISSSPRKKGNSDLLCDSFMKGARESGHTVTKILLRDMIIGGCYGCYTCERTGACVQKDDMTEVLDKLVKADVIVMASPVYFYTICSQMKQLIDRCIARWLEFHNKEFYYIVTAADTDQANLVRAVECFRGFAECLDGSEEKGVIYGAGAQNKGDVETMPVMQEAYEMGKSV